MAWPFDAEGVDPVIGGALAGAKFRALQEDLKLTQLQRAQYELDAGHRQQMSALEEALGQSRLSREQLGMEIDRVQSQAQLGLTQAQTEGSKASTARTRQSTRQDQKLFPYQVKSQQAAIEQSLAGTAASKAQTERTTQGTKLDAEKAKLDALGAQLGVASAAGKAAGSHDVSIGDIGLLAGQFTEALGIKDPNAKALWANQFAGEVDAQKQALAQEKMKLGYYQQQQSNELATLVKNLSFLPEPALDGLRDSKFFPPEIIQAAKNSAGAFANERNVSPLAVEQNKELVKEAFKLRDAIREQQAVVESTKASAGTDIFLNRNRDAIAAQEKILDSLKAQYKETTDQLDSLSKTETSPKSSAKTPAIVDVKTPDEAAKLPKGTRYRTPDGRVFTR